MMYAPAELEELRVAAAGAAEAAAAKALAWRARPDELRVERKAAADDLVSQADREAEAAARTFIAERRPCDSFAGEESAPVSGTTGIRWAVDPIDGTTSYLYGRPDWAVSVAAVDERDGRVLAAAVSEPALGRLTCAHDGGGAWCGGQPLRRASARLDCALVEVNFGSPVQRRHAGALVGRLLPEVRDLRRTGSAAGALAAVAAGRADAYWGPGLREWDVAAGLLLVAEAGGTVGTLDGEMPPAWPHGGDVLAAAPGLFEPLRALIASVTLQSCEQPYGHQDADWAA